MVRVIHVRLSASRDTHPGAGAPEAEVWDGLEVFRVQGSPRRPWELVRSVSVLVRGLRWADVLHTMAFSSVLAAMVPWLLRRPGGGAVPWVHTEHWTGALDPGSVSPLWNRLSWLRHVYRLPHQVTGVGTALADAMRPFARSGAVSVVPCVVRSPESVVDAEFGFPLKLVAVGAVIGRKRPVAVVETVKWLRRQGHDVELVWVGDGPLRADCESLVRDSGLEGAVRFVGAVAPQEVAGYLGNADLFVLPSEHETFFASAAEAIGAGRAVVISRLDGLGDFLSEDNSILVDGADPDVLGGAVLQARDRFRQVPAESIAAPIRAAYSVEAVGSLFETVYGRAIVRA
jgi:glycosyltransferase involved in cell wall biosynthesis